MYNGVSIKNFYDCRFCITLSQTGRCEFGLWQVIIGNSGKLKRLILRLVLAVLAGMPGWAVAQQIDTSQPGAALDQARVVQAYAGQTYVSDSNVFRAPTAQSNGSPTGDTSLTRIFGLQLDKSFGLQRITGNVNVSKTSYDHFTFIDYMGKDAQLSWNWAVGKDVSGNLGTTYSESITPYTVFHTPTLNLRVQKSQVVSSTFLATPSWRIHGSVTDSKVSYNLASQQIGDRNDQISDFGIDYISAMQNTLGLIFMRDVGTYPVPQQIGGEILDNNYTQDSAKLNMKWTPTGHISMQLMAGWVRRRYETFAIRDVDGPTVRVDATYTISDKTVLSAAAWRQVNASDDLSVSYSIDRGISFSPTWDMSAKIRILGSLKRESLDYTGASLVSPLLPQNRIDTRQNASLSAVYSPLPRVQFTVLMYVERLQSTFSIYDYRDKGLSLNGRVAF